MEEKEGEGREEGEGEEDGGTSYTPQRRADRSAFGFSRLH